MIHSIGVKELATEKTLLVDPTDLGVRIFMYNKALEERMHIELDLEDMIAVNKVLEKRISDLKLAEEGYIKIGMYSRMLRKDS